MVKQRKPPSSYQLGQIMLYNTHFRKFDTSMVKAVDVMFDQILSQAPNMSLSPIQDLIEFRTLYLTLPRQCGKSHYINEVSKMFTNPVIFTPTIRLANNCYHRRNDVFSVKQIRNNPAWLIGLGVSKPDVFFFDEVPYEDAICILQTFEWYMNGISRRAVVLGLRT